MNRRNIWLIMIPVILFLLLAVFIKAGTMEGFETWAYYEVVKNMSPLMTDIFLFITRIGDSIFVIFLCLLLIIIPKARKNVALPVSCTVIISTLLNFTLKLLFARERPDILRIINETDYSFPSGHAMINSSLYLMLIFLINKYIERKISKVIMTGICVILILSISYSRIYLGVHYAGDIIGGWLFGFAISISVYYIWNDRVSVYNVNNKKQ